jgi:hypothetical protein
MLVQEYRVLRDEAMTVIDGHIGAVEVLEDMVKGLGSDAKAYRLARSKVQRVEREKIKDWKTFVDVKAESGIQVEDVVKEIIDKHAEISL